MSTDQITPELPSPIRMTTPELVAPDTHVIRQVAGEGMGPVAVYVNSAVITGAQPVIVDTGAAINREAWMETVFSIVDPVDVRWVFLSHDDVDHTGNLLQVLDACPNATLVANAFMVERMSADYGLSLPMHRMRWVNHGDRIDAGDRELVAVTPPVFDSPTTRGLFDTTSKVYWASDAMGSPIPHEIDDIRELEPGFWRETFLEQQLFISPWLNWSDPAKYERLVQGVADLGAEVVTSGHGAALRGDQIDSALRLVRELPYLPPATLPGQADLDAIVASLAVPPAAPAPAAA